MSLISTSPSANIPATPRFFGECDIVTFSARHFVWGAVLDIITNFFNICSTSNLPAKLYIEYSHCYFFLPNSIYIWYVLQKSFLCSHTVWSTLRTVFFWYDAPRAGFSKIDPRPLSASDTAGDRGKNGKFSKSVDKYCPSS